MGMSRKEASRLIDEFIAGTCGCYDWDDFISIRHDDYLIEQVRQECLNLPDKYPANISTSYCDDDGIEKLRSLSALLMKS